MPPAHPQFYKRFGGLKQPELTFNILKIMNVIAQGGVYAMLCD